VPANGFYEWKAVATAGRMVKQPYYIRPADGDRLFGFAGLTERWVFPEREEIYTCCIITTDANAVMALIPNLGSDDHCVRPEPSRLSLGLPGTPRQDLRLRPN
jgi:hypothetical protein